MPAVRLPDSLRGDSFVDVHKAEHTALFSTVYLSGGQVSKPGQAGECEPGGRQGCSGKHQHQN